MRSLFALLLCAASVSAYIIGPPGSGGLVKGYLIASEDQLDENPATQAENLNLRFSIISATRGGTLDTDYARHLQLALDHGLMHGALHRADPSSTQTATQQAAFFTEHGGRWTNDEYTLPGTLYIQEDEDCYDMEKRQLEQWIWQFIDKYYELNHRYPILRTTNEFLEQCVEHDGRSWSFSWMRFWTLPRYGDQGIRPAGFGQVLFDQESYQSMLPHHVLWSFLTQQDLVAFASWNAEERRPVPAAVAAWSPPPPVLGYHTADDVSPPSTANGMSFAFLTNTRGETGREQSFQQRFRIPLAGALHVGLVHVADPRASDGGGQALRLSASESQSWRDQGRALPGVLQLDHSESEQDPCYDLDRDQMIKWLWDFIETYHKKRGRYPILRTSRHFFRMCLGPNAHHDFFFLELWGAQTDPLPPGWDQRPFEDVADQQGASGHVVRFSGGRQALQDFAARTTDERRPRPGTSSGGSDSSIWPHEPSLPRIPPELGGQGSSRGTDLPPTTLPPTDSRNPDTGL